MKLVFENKGKLATFLLLKKQDWSDSLTQTLTEFCEENRENFVCAFADETHEIYKGVSRFFKSEESDNTSVLGYLDYGIKNGWKVPEVLTSTK